MRTPVKIYERNKNFTATVQPKNACKLEVLYHLWLPFPEQPQSENVVFQ